MLVVAISFAQMYGRTYLEVCVCVGGGGGGSVVWHRCSVRWAWGFPAH
eukprot:SAG31_NODE_142_length_22669_cov_18.630040_18_plen_47_part_01